MPVVKIMRIARWLMYRTGWTVSRCLFGSIWRLNIVGSEHIPKNDPVILASNHLANVDPFVVGCSICREAFFIGKEELFNNLFLGWVLRMVNGFPVKRGKQDISAFKTALQVLGDEKILTMFPEGHRNPLGKPLKPKSGVGLLAKLSGAAVVPTLISNTDRLLQFPRISVTFGKPIYFDGGHTARNTEAGMYRRFAEQVMREIGTLRRSGSKSKNGSEQG